VRSLSTKKNQNTVLLPIMKNSFSRMDIHKSGVAAILLNLAITILQFQAVAVTDSSAVSIIIQVFIHYFLSVYSVSPYVMISVMDQNSSAKRSKP
jgi:hypothetical protein